MTICFTFKSTTGFQTGCAFSLKIKLSKHSVGMTMDFESMRKTLQSSKYCSISLYISDIRNIIKVLEGMSMNYITTKEVAAKWGITDRMVLYHCTLGRIDGAVKMGNTWLIPYSIFNPMLPVKSSHSMPI